MNCPDPIELPLHGLTQHPELTIGRIRFGQRLVVGTGQGQFERAQGIIELLQPGRTDDGRAYSGTGQQPCQRHLRHRRRKARRHLSQHVKHLVVLRRLLFMSR